MRFRGTTEEGEVVGFKIYCEDSHSVTEYGSELGVYVNGWKYIKKDTLVCLEVEDLKRQLAEANSMTEHYRNLWLEICISHNELNLKLQEQLKEKGDE